MEPGAWRFVCAMHRRTSLTIIDLFFTAEDVAGDARIASPTNATACAYFPIGRLPQPLAGYIGVAIDCLQGRETPFGRFHQEGWE